jgi:mono/diheme cytochrome c family protein
MRPRNPEILATLATLALVASAWLLPFRVEAYRRAARAEGVERVVTLTAVGDLGIWTEDKVVAANYWRSDLRPARLTLEMGRPILLRLQSADVMHTFYAPDLGIGPLDVYPGRVVEARVTPRETGTFEYFCTTVCGEAHFVMKGEVMVTEMAAERAPGVARSEPPHWTLEPPVAGASRQDWGHWHFEQKGCATCHGTAGRAGIKNANSMNPKVLGLDSLAANLFLFAPEDVGAFVHAIEEGHDLESLADRPPVPLYGSVLTQYRAVRKVIREGRKTVPMDPDGPIPPLDMLAWKHRLSDDDIDAILAYLLTAEPPATDQQTRMDRGPQRTLEFEQKGSQP